VTDTEFAEAKKFWLMFQAKETFKAVHQGCLELVRSGLGKESPLYFPTIAGLICLYGKPFKNNKGVGKLPRDMVPKEQLSLHDQLIVIRDQLYAHSDASETVIAGTLHFGEVRAYRWPDDGGYYLEHLHIAPEFFSKFMAELARHMAEKTLYDLSENSLARTKQNKRDYGLGDRRSAMDDIETLFDLSGSVFDFSRVR